MKNEKKASKIDVLDETIFLLKKWNGDGGATNKELERLSSCLDEMKKEVEGTLTLRKEDAEN